MNGLDFAEKNEKTMTTKEVAEALNVSVDTIQNACKKLQATSENFPKFSQGQRAVYNEAQVTAIKLELQSHSKVNALSPKTTLEKQLLIQQAMQLQAEMIAELQAENEAQKQQLAIQAPKAQWFDDVADSCNRGINRRFHPIFVDNSPHFRGFLSMFSGEYEYIFGAF